MSEDRTNPGKNYFVAESYSNISMEGTECTNGHSLFDLQVRHGKQKIKTAHVVLICVECGEENVMVLDMKAQKGYRLINNPKYPVEVRPGFFVGDLVIRRSQGRALTVVSEEEASKDFGEDFCKHPGRLFVKEEDGSILWGEVEIFTKVEE